MNAISMLLNISSDHRELLWSTVECQWIRIWKKFMKYVFIHFLSDFYTIRQILEGNTKQNIKVSNCSQAILF